jgi:23S rRNA pseudouridine2457 synthase
MAALILLNKPYRVLSQFSGDGERRTLADFIQRQGFYPAGRLDFDSEGLLMLTDNGALQARISDPRHRLWKRYLVQVEGVPDAAALATLSEGVMLRDGRTRRARVRVLASPPDLWPRDPAIRPRPGRAVSWLELSLREGRNRQVRRMTAAVGLPTLRLVRWSIGDWSLDGLQPGQSRCIEVHLPAADRRRRAR